jgi:hypothetical protein
MSSSTERVRELLARVGTLEFAETIPGAPDATIEPTRRISEQAAQGVLEALAQLIARGGHNLEPRFQLGEILGQGGMGLVRLARQVALDRDVAVKVLRPNKRSPEATADLLQEAWITGGLEHPNVVPVHDIGIDADGNPVIVFKRIGGMTWSALLGNAGEVERRFGAGDLLEWNLRILMQVINAVRFAHSRGIVHRDLKPDNVMIGEFGEVYVVDWGIAVSLHDGDGDRLPSAAHATDLAGTPSYMAPEMLGGAEPEISERTDIYLLGAILYQILTGKPPHEGETTLEVFTSVVASAPVLPADAPPGLALVCRRAMAAEPDQRFASAEELLRAVQEFLEHRGSEVLVHQAEVNFDEMRRFLRADSHGDEQARIDHRKRLYGFYGACRFGFIEALSAWRENQAARAGLRAASEAMIAYELAHGDPHAAATLAADVAHVVALSPELQARVDEALRAKAREDARRAELERLGRELDIRIGARTRALVVLCMGLSWVGLPLIGPLISHLSDVYPGNLRMAMWSVGLATVFALVAYLVRASLWQSAINRRLVIMMLTMFLGQALLHLGSELGGILPATSQTFQFFFWFGVIGVVTIMAERRLFPTALAYLLAYFVVARLPDARFLAIAAVNTVLLVNATVIWLPRNPQADQSAPPRAPQP